MVVDNLKAFKYGCSAFGILSLLSPFIHKLVRISPFFLRSFLNISWGFLFGSHLWHLLLSKENIVDDYLTDVDRFYLTNVACSGFLILSTVGLAPNYTSLVFSSYVTLGSSLLNYYFVVPHVQVKEGDKNDEFVLFKYLKPSKCSTILLSTTLLCLALYAFI